MIIIMKCSSNSAETVILIILLDYIIMISVSSLIDMILIMRCSSNTQQNSSIRSITFVVCFRHQQPNVTE